LQIEKGTFPVIAGTRLFERNQLVGSIGEGIYLAGRRDLGGEGGYEFNLFLEITGGTTFGLMERKGNTQKEEFLVLERGPAKK